MNRQQRRMAKFGHFSPHRPDYLDTTLGDLSVGRDINAAEAEMWANSAVPVLTTHDLLWWEAPNYVHFAMCDESTQFRLVPVD